MSSYLKDEALLISHGCVDLVKGRHLPQVEIQVVDPHVRGADYEGPPSDDV
ncbi:hypothetical protein [Microbispora bryophytorum]|uniref:hypothetical protein n=1 Tax=Microbispora bryophytorum TaxID=1460882 RepID=UPI003F4D16D2